MPEAFLYKLTDSAEGLIYRYAAEARNHAKYTQDVLVDLVNEMNLSLAKSICEWNKDNRIIEVTYTLTANQSDYLWPPNFYDFRRLYKANSYGWVIQEYKPRGLHADYFTGIIELEAERGFRIMPPPTQTGDWTLQYQAAAVPMLHYGTAQGVTSSTIQFADSATLGDISEEDDYYIGENIHIVSASSGSGQVRKITDYDGSTKTATVSPDFSPTPTGTVVYEIAPAIVDINYTHLVALEIAHEILLTEGEYDAAEAKKIMAGRRRSRLIYPHRRRIVWR